MKKGIMLSLAMATVFTVGTSTVSKAAALTNLRVQR